MRRSLSRELAQYRPTRTVARIRATFSCSLKAWDVTRAMELALNLMARGEQADQIEGA